jgi:ubiquitin carboxyl-terminal hydrolase 14
MNATIQALRAIPELEVALSSCVACTTVYIPLAFTHHIFPRAPSVSPLPKELRSLFGGMQRTTEAINPGAFLQVLRVLHPQFAQVSSGPRSLGMSFSFYAQQGLFFCLFCLTSQ